MIQTIIGSKTAMATFSATFAASAFMSPVVLSNTGQNSDDDRFITSGQEENALMYYNALREQAGLDQVQRRDSLGYLARGHARYLYQEETTGHLQQNPTNPFFTGETLNDRAEDYDDLLNLSHPHNLTIGEGIAYGFSDPVKSVQGLIDAPFHRSGLMAPYTSHAGIGLFDGPYANRATVINYGWSPSERNQTNEIIAYPADGQDSIEPYWYVNENPNPLSPYDLDRVLTGYPISLEAYGHNALSLTAEDITLTDDNGEDVSVYIVDSTNHDAQEAIRNQILIIPEEPLDYDTTYHVDAEMTLNTRDAEPAQVRESWHFETKEIARIQDMDIQDDYLTFDFSDRVLPIHSGIFSIREGDRESGAIHTTKVFHNGRLASHTTQPYEDGLYTMTIDSEFMDIERLYFEVRSNHVRWFDEENLYEGDAEEPEQPEDPEEPVDEEPGNEDNSNQDGSESEEPEPNEPPEEENPTPPESDEDQGEQPEDPPSEPGTPPEDESDEEDHEEPELTGPFAVTDVVMNGDELQITFDHGDSAIRTATMSIREGERHSGAIYSTYFMLDNQMQTFGNPRPFEQNGLYTIEIDSNDTNDDFIYVYALNGTVDEWSREPIYRDEESEEPVEEPISPPEEEEDPVEEPVAPKPDDEEPDEDGRDEEETDDDHDGESDEGNSDDGQDQHEDDQHEDEQEQDQDHEQDENEDEQEEQEQDPEEPSQPDEDPADDEEPQESETEEQRVTAMTLENGMLHLTFNKDVRLGTIAVREGVSTSGSIFSSTFYRENERQDFGVTATFDDGLYTAYVDVEGIDTTSYFFIVENGSIVDYNGDLDAMDTEGYIETPSMTHPGVMFNTAFTAPLSSMTTWLMERFSR